MSPLYDWICPECGYKTEVLQFSQTEVIHCIKCKAGMVRKFPSNIMVKMKGEGGYPSRRKQVFNTTMRNHPKLG